MLYLMGQARIVNWDDTTLPFGNSPSIRVPTVDQLREDVAAGIEWHWFYRGLPGIITKERMANALSSWDAVQQQRHRREPMPESVGVFRWDDVISAEDRQKFAKADASGDSAPGRKAD